jgi:hypothetical protein
MRGSICRVAFAWDVSGEDHAFMVTSGMVYPFEDFIAGSASALTSPPAFHDTAIIFIYLEINARGAQIEDCEYKELETNTFCPTDVMSLALPSWKQVPGLPSPIDDDPDPMTRASVQIGKKFMDGAESWDGSSKVL